MAEMGIPAVFSFCISYHIWITSMLGRGRTVFGYECVHDDVEGLVGKELVAMKKRSIGKDMTTETIATFGKSTYIESFLGMSMVPSLFVVGDAMLDSWDGVDLSTVVMMDWAVITLTGSWSIGSGT